jgi:hypothetical protein
MPNEFIIKNGFRSQGNSEISGSISVLNGATIFNNLTINTSNLPILNLFDSLQSHTWQFRSNGTSLFLRDNDNNRLWIGGVGSGNGGKIGINVINTTAQLTIRGSGATSGTTALLVQDANARSLFHVSDDGRVGINNTPYDTYSLAVGPLSGSTVTYVAQRAAANSTNEYRFIYTGTPNAGTSAGSITWSTVAYLEGINTSNIVDGFRTIDLRIRGWSGSYEETARFTYDSKFGVGTPTPTAKVHISGSSGSALFEIDSPAVNNILFVSGSGNVGINTGTPSRALEVFRSGLVDGSINGIRISVSHGSSNAQAALEFNHSSFGRLSRIATDVGNGGNDPSMYFIHNGVNAMKIANTGNVQIGTTTDSGYKFDVNGTFRATVSTETTPFVISHTNGNFATILIGNGSQLAAGQMGMYFNGTPMWTWNGSVFRLPGNTISTQSNPSTLQIFGGWGGATVGTSLRLGSNTNNQGVFTATTGTQSTVEIGNSGNETWSPSSGNATYNLLNLVPRFNTTGTYSGISRGLYYAPTLTSITGLTHRAIETVTGDVLFGTTSGNVGIGTTTPTSRLSVSGSAGTGSAIYAYKSGSTVLDIQGSQGQLFSVVDALSGSLMSVNDVSGLPILEVFSDDRVVMGTYGAPALIVTGSNTVISGSLRGRVVTLSTASATASMDCSLSNFFDLTLSGSMYLGVSNIQPGETINLRITQPATSGSLNYTSSIKFPNGLPYSASATSSVVDLISFISFDSSTLYATSLKNLI